MIDVQIVGLLVGVILPLLVGLVTTRVTHAATKAVLLALLSAVTGFLSELLSDHFDLKTALITWLGAFLVAVGVHFGLWKPTGVSARLQLIGSKRGPGPQIPGRADHAA